MNNAQDRNRELGRRINEEALSDPNSPYAGKFVGIVAGRVAVVADDLDQLGQALDEMSADPAETFCLEAGRDYSRVHEVWSRV